MQRFGWQLFRFRRFRQFFNRRRLVFGEDGPRRGGLLRERHFAFAAIAASETLFAEVVVAGILGAADADSRGFFSTNTT